MKYHPSDRAFDKYQLFRLAATLAAGQNAGLSVQDSVALMMRYVAALEQADEHYCAKERRAFEDLRKP